MRRSLATRLSALYAALLGVTIVLVILASSIALVYELIGYTGDILAGKHDEARMLTDEYLADGRTLTQAAPMLAGELSGIGLRVAVYDDKGHFLGGDKTLRPAILDRIISGHFSPSSTGTSARLRLGIQLPRHPVPSPLLRDRLLRPGTSSGDRSTVGGLVYHENRDNGPGMTPSPLGPVPPQSHFERPYLAQVTGGYVAFAPSSLLLLTSLVPYWKVVIAIAIAAILLSWLIGRVFARQALRPIDEVTDSLQAVARGDFTQRRFVMAGGDEVATLTAAFNEAVAGVSSAMEERHRVEERMRQFVADAGHELRTPLTVIGGYIDVLRRGAIEEATVARQILGTMALEKEHMRGLIDRLMRLARLDGEAPPRKEPIDIAELLRNQCDAARRLDETRRIDYSVEGAGEVIGDRTELGETLWNAVENALKYAPDAAIHLSAVHSEGATVISVSDEGPGMSEAERLHAFERFYRGDERGEIVGAGLGLAIAKRAVERAGGTIALDSAPGQGTTVTIRLPDSA